MATEQQIIANRRDAENGKSVRPYLCDAEAKTSASGQGPETEEGKKVSRMNALRHGLTGQIEVTTPEEKEARDRFCGEIESSLAPEGGIERQLSHSVAEDHWQRSGLIPAM